MSVIAFQQLSHNEIKLNTFNFLKILLIFEKA